MAARRPEHDQEAGGARQRERQARWVADPGFSTGKRAMLVAVGLVDAGKRQNGKHEYGSKPAEPSGTARSGWTKRLAEAGIVLDYAPELVNDVLSARPGIISGMRRGLDRKTERELLIRLALALISSKEASERTSRSLVRLTFALVVLTAVLVAMTGALLTR